jgi:Ribosomal protein S13
MALRRDVETMIKTKSWKGVRHSLGLKVRGQKTKTTGRLGQTVGVKRKKEIAQAQQQKTEASK